MIRVPVLSVPIALWMLTPAAADLLRALPNVDLPRLERGIADRTGMVWEIVVRGTSHPRPTIRVQSTILDSERVRRFGVDGRRFASDESKEAYIARRVQVFGDDRNSFDWILPTKGVGSVADAEQGAAWLNVQAEAFARFLADGCYQFPVPVAVA